MMVFSCSCMLSINFSWANPACTPNASVTSDCQSLSISNPNVSISIANGVTVSDSSFAVVNPATGTEITNNGTISSGFIGVYNTGTITSLINFGSITASYAGIYNSSTITTLTNAGTITSPNYSINNNGTIATINNSQGGVNTFKLSNSLPGNYNIIINSPTSYGQLSVISPTGSMAFGIYAGGVSGVPVSAVSAGTYADVLQGFSSLSGITGTTGTYNGYSYSLVADSGHSDYWNLVFTSLSSNILAGHVYQSSGLGSSVNPTIDGGTLQISNAGNISENFTITSNGGKIDSNGLTSNLSGVISDSIPGSGGKLTISNSVSGGSLTLSNVNTYSGGTEVDAGAKLTISSGSALGTGILALAGSATVPATLTVTGTTTITNPITVAGDPVFNIAPGTTTTVSSAITDGATPGDVELGGGGTLALTAANTYTGSTTIDSGSTLNLAGNGSIANSSAVTNSGTFNITGAANTVNLAGAYTQSGTGNLTMGLTPSASQLLHVSGLASLGGTLSLNATNGVYAPHRYTLLTATGGIGKHFSSLSTNLSSFTRLGYYLSYDARDVYLNLIPATVDTQAALAANVNALQGVYALQTGTINNSLTYDCANFDKRGFCLSTGGRYSNASETHANTTSAMVIGAYKINDNIRAGGYLDQNLYNTNVASVASLRSNTPLLGMFAVWNKNADKTGLEAKLAIGYNNSDLNVNRIAIGTSERGVGRTSMNTLAGSGTVSYGFKITSNWMTAPYFGVRYTSVSTNAYNEQSSAAVTNPLTYSRLTEASTTALLGIRLAGKVMERTTIQTSAGFEQDMQNSVTNYTATGLPDIAPITFNPDINRTRAVASFGASYKLARGHLISFKTIYRQESFRSVDTKMAYVNYTMSF